MATHTVFASTEQITCTGITLQHSELGRYWRGKIEQAVRGIIHVILLEILHYLSSQILQARLSASPVLVVCRHASLPCNNCKYCFSSPQGAFSYNF